LVILPKLTFSFNLALGESLPLPSKSAMSVLAKSPEQDWTHLLTDPQLVGHIGKLLQAYREAAPDKREEALLAAMRNIRKDSVALAAQPVKATAVQSGGLQAGSAPARETILQSSSPADETSPKSPDAEPPPSEPGLQTVQPPFVPDFFTPSLGQDRRTYPRLRCFIAVELKCEGWDVPVWGNLANVSASGCFIETLEPVRKSTKLEVGLWANNGKIWVKGIVINGVVTENNPTFGVRLKYTNMDANDRDTLRFFLKFVEDTTKSYEKQNGYVAQLKR
jgi:PilZ domain-containing protein